MDDSFRMRKAFFDIKKHSSVSLNLYTLEKEGLEQIETTSKCLPNLEHHLQKHQFWGELQKRNLPTKIYQLIFSGKVKENGPQQNSMSISKKNALVIHLMMNSCCKESSAGRWSSQVAHPKETSWCARA